MPCESATVPAAVSYTLRSGISATVPAREREGAGTVTSQKTCVRRHETQRNPAENGVTRPPTRTGSGHVLPTPRTETAETTRDETLERYCRLLCGRGTDRGLHGLRTARRGGLRHLGPRRLHHLRGQLHLGQRLALVLRPRDAAARKRGLHPRQRHEARRRGPVDEPALNKAF